MKSLVRQYFDINVTTIKGLAGYENANFLIESPQGRYILKTYPFHEETANILKAESEVLDRLARNGRNNYPKPMLSVNGNFVEKGKAEGETLLIRLLTFVEGEFLAEAGHTPSLLASFGAFLAEMDLALREIKNDTIAARRYRWDLQHIELNRASLSDISDPHDRAAAEYFLMQFREQVAPVLPELRRSIIHNDANDQNVLVTNGVVSGIIDFGDMVFSPLIHELAVALTYVMMGKDDSLSAAAHVLKAYHEKLPLLPEEIDLLYWLIAGRLCISVLNSARSRKLDPGNDYISISERPARDLLHRMLTINPQKAGDAFRSTLAMPVSRPQPVSEKVSQRHKVISPILSLSYDEPLYVNRAAFQYMYDVYGNTFLDAYNNIPHVGHSHPRVAEAGQRQMARLNTNTRYVYDLLETYAARLLEKFPPQLSKVFFVNSGSAAADLAVRLAIKHTNHPNLMVMEHGYHGHTLTATSISDYKFSHPKGPGRQPHILKAPLPDTYKGKYTGPDAGRLYAREAMEKWQNFHGPLAAFITEPIVGCGGQVPLAEGYLRALVPAIHAAGGVFISDEVQTGFGRLGRWFWGFEMHGVVPDIVVLGKPMGNGHPIGAVVTTGEIAASFEDGPEFFSSFGGNPVSCAIGLAVLDVMEEEGLQRHALEVGDHYKKLLNELKNDHPEIADVRGEGLFLGVEMEDENGRPGTKLAALIKNEMRRRHILLSTDGPYDSVIKTKPPLCFSKENAARVVQTVHEIMVNF